MENTMDGHHLCKKIGLVHSIIPYDVEEKEYRESNIEYDSFLHKDEYSCIVYIDGKLETVRAKWLNVLARRKDDENGSL